MLDQIKKATRFVGSQFTRPDEDWVMALFYRKPDNTVSVAMLPNDPTPESVTEIIKRNKAVEAVFVASTWTVVREGSPFGPPISEDPEKTESLMLMRVDREEIEVTFANIMRFDDQPPILGTWAESMYDSDISGGYADAIRLGIG